MQLTPAAASFLRGRSLCGSDDINAVDNSLGIEFSAAQVQCKDDKRMRRLLQLYEFQPVLQVHSATWLGTFGKYPSIRFIVMDGNGDSMVMFVSYRLPGALKYIFSKKGPFRTGRLNKGKKFRPLDYTTIIHRNNDGSTESCILVEKIHTKPRR